MSDTTQQQPPALLTAVEAADALGLRPSRVKQLAVAMGVGARFGRAWAFTAADVAAMQERAPVGWRKGRKRGKTAEGTEG